MANQSKTTFTADPRADIVLVTSDNAHFPVRKIHLQASSDVFDGMFATVSADAGHKDNDTGLPCLSLDATEDDLLLLLKAITPDKVVLGAETLSLDQTGRLLQTSDKYQVPLGKAWAEAQLRLLAPKNPTGVLGHALVHGLKDVARYAASYLDGTRTWRLEYCYHEDGRNLKRISWPDGSPKRVSRIPADLLNKIPSKWVIELMEMEEDVLLHPGKSWKTDAKKLKFA